MNTEFQRRGESLSVGTASALAMGGWSLVLGLLVYDPEWLKTPTVDLQILWLGLLAVVARLLAFNVHSSSRIAIDSAFYIAAVFISGGANAAILVLIVLTLDASARVLRGDRESMLARANIVYILYKSGLPALALMLLTIGFSETRLMGASDLQLWWLLPTYSLTFLLVHYALVGSHKALESADGREIRPIVSRAVAAELSLIPLSLAMVLAHRSSGVGLMVLLGATGLFTSMLFRRSILLSHALTKRVRDLSNLNESGKLLAASIDEERLLKHLPEALRQLSSEMAESILELGLISEEYPGCFVVHEYPADRSARTSRVVSLDETPASGALAVCEGGFEVLSQNVFDGFRNSNGEKVRVIGLPLVAGDACLGAIWITLPLTQRIGTDFFRVFQIAVDQVAVALNNTKLYALATVDGLTGLFIRRYLDQRAAEEWERFKRYGTTFSVIMIDLDRFKRLNDRFGHQAGDLALQVAANAVSTNMRGFDVAARYGGEELACFLPRTTVSEAGVVAERIRADIEAAEVIYQGVRIAVSASLGVADSTQKAFDCWEMVRVHADEALLEAKERGRNRVVLATSERISRESEG